MTERTVLLLLLVVLVAAGSLVVRHASRRRVNSALGTELPAGLAERLPLHEPAIVYFHGNHCGACRRFRRVTRPVSDS